MINGDQNIPEHEKCYPIKIDAKMYDVLTLMSNEMVDESYRWGKGDVLRYNSITGNFYSNDHAIRC